MPSRCASSTSSSAWLAPSRNEKFDLHHSGAYTGQVFSPSVIAVNALPERDPRAPGSPPHRGRFNNLRDRNRPEIFCVYDDSVSVPPTSVVHVHHRGDRGVDGILRLIELASHDGPFEETLCAMCDEVA